MHIAIGYSWFPTAAGYHMERAFRSLGHKVTYVGLPCSERAGYDSSVNVSHIVNRWSDKPDLFLWIDPAGRYFPKAIEELSIPTACYLIDVHLGEWRKQVARFFDAVFIAQKDYLSAYRKSLGHEQVYWLPLAAASDVHYQHNLKRIYDVGFVGNIAISHRNTPRARRLELIGRRFLTNDLYGRYSPEQVGVIYSQSRIVFNTSIASDVTMRVFEGTACGALMLTDSAANGLEELFEPGREVVTYKDDNDLVEKISYYLSHDNERTELARAGHDRTEREHYYTHRAEALLHEVSTPSFQKCAPIREASSNERYRALREVYIHLHMVDAILDASKNKGKRIPGRAIDVVPALIRRLMI